jgi:hypothetical protein
MKMAMPSRSQSRSDAGVEANTRLTAATGLVLTAMLLVEGFTVLNVRGYITLHTFLGLALVGPLALKAVTTFYRFARYYSGRAAYVRRGAPPLLLRVIGPFVVLSSLAVVGTGVVLIADHGNSDRWIFLHKASFVVFIVLTGVHFLGHIFEAITETVKDIRSPHGDPARRSRAVRTLLVVGAFAVGIAVAAVFTPSAATWNIAGHFH